MAAPVALAALAAVAVIWLLDDEPDLRDGSVIADGPPVAVVRTPETYRIDYRVTGRGGGEVVTTSDRLWVRRPFDSRLESFEEEAPTAEQLSVQVASLGHLLADSANSAEVVLVRPPAPAVSDVRVDAVLEEALERGLLERRERREVLGRPCQVYRSSAILGTARLSEVGDDEYVDSCVDEAGLVLEDVLLTGGDRILLRRVAIEVEEDVAVDDRLFATGESTVPQDLGGGLLRELTPTSRTPDHFFEPIVPDGFARVGRYAVVASATPDESGQVTPVNERSAFVSDVLVRGTDVIIIDQGTSTREDPQPPPGADTVDLGALGTGELIFDARQSAVQIVLPDRRFVRVSGTAPIDDLVELARTLRRTDGGELDPLD